ncbi:hypothetical protein [Paraburkholderia sp. LEh10]|nr:hypothetical protein [Paraburkholderia sp. LEh10]
MVWFWRRYAILCNTFVKPVVLAPLPGFAVSLAGWSLPTLLT